MVDNWEGGCIYIYIYILGVPLVGVLTIRALLFGVYWC